MDELYRILHTADPNRTTRILTVVAGTDFGAKCLLTGGELAWEKGSFFSAHAAALSPLTATGNYTLDGQRVFCDVLGREKKVVLCGGGHVGLALIRLCRLAGYPVTLLEDRSEFAQAGEKAGADRVICAPFADALAEIEGDSDTFFVIATRAHQYDQTCLRLISRKKHAYIGLMGSKKRVNLLKEALIAEGGNSQVLHAIHAPIGLSIGAETPQEIAVSIMAELIEVKSRLGSISYPRELMHAIVDYHGEQAGEPMALATIVHCEGSVPRGMSTKMLVRRDGSFVGTIGGGRVELAVLDTARAKLTVHDNAPLLLPLDLTGQGNPEDALLCGGKVEVLIEII